MIPPTDAIIYPLAMMVEFTDASIANVTMPTVQRVCSLTVGTECIWIHFLYKFLELKFWHTSNVAWIIKSCSEIAKVDNHEKYVEQQNPVARNIRKDKDMQLNEGAEHHDKIVHHSVVVSAKFSKRCFYLATWYRNGLLAKNTG